MSDSDDLLLLAGIGAIVGLGAAAYVVSEEERRARERRADAFARLFTEVAKETARLSRREAAARARLNYQRLMDDFHAADRLCKAAKAPLHDANKARSVMRSEIDRFKRKMHETYQMAVRTSAGGEVRTRLHEQLASMKVQKESMLADLDRMNVVVGRFQCNVEDLIDQREGLREEIRESGSRGAEWHAKWAHLQPENLGAVRSALVQAGWLGRLGLSAGRRLWMRGSLAVRSMRRVWRSKQREREKARASKSRECSSAV